MTCHADGPRDLERKRDDATDPLAGERRGTFG